MVDELLYWLQTCFVISARISILRQRLNAKCSLITRTTLTEGRNEFRNVICVLYVERSGSYFPACHSRGSSLMQGQFMRVCDGQSDTGTVFPLPLLLLLLLLLLLYDHN